MKKIIISLFILNFFVVNIYADNHKSPWKFMQGRWQVEEEYGFKSEVVFFWGGRVFDPPQKKVGLKTWWIVLSMLV